MTELEASPAQTSAPTAAVEYRSSNVVGVTDVKQRIIEVIATPYEQPARVEYRGELWNEIFERGAWAGLEKRPNRVRANRDHDRMRTVGRVINFWPNREEGLVAAVKIANTTLGDDTLGLAEDDCLSASVGFAVMGSKQQLDRHTMTRRIKLAYMDHLSFVPDPAYEGASVLSVRHAGAASDLKPLVTPEMDEFKAWYDSFKAAHKR